ncbi:WS/DGAT/MGAT family O-acyltransferase [Rhodococcus sp. NPDC003382]|uniref:WS/DGAT/MGAT family O-acyltransferase n=1 Tax=Rhodococcus sp. CX TaxID=2789880 RepID=UPI0018CFA355|nr:wax ester/triacylglycerol synthase family O-acyltransferase [Rhodococcus sp. CX]MBH0118186.1 wax ester/triacylglycerol synthase family O-acyltransferase [Rhodococcus sp. CX]
MSVTDSIFLFAETREHPMHVGSVQLFTPPADAGPDYVADLYARMIGVTDIDPLFRRRPGDPVSTLGHVWWSEDRDVDLEYHVRHSALPAPGRFRELFALVSRLHGTLLDRHRPLWEMYLIEGLEGGRFAWYSKIHHSLVDGVSALRLLQRTLSPDPDLAEPIAPWHLPRPDRAGSDGAAPSGSLLGTAGALLGTARSLAGDVADAVPAAVRIGRLAVGPRKVALPYEAPRTMFNVPIGGARRFAAQSWDRERLARVRRAADVSGNDVVLAMCAGALRAYLLEHDALPDDPLIAMVPVSLRPKDRPGDGGNSVGVTLCNLGTDRADPLDRLSVISDSMSQGKSLFGDMTALQALAWSGFIISPLGLAPVPGFVRLTPPPFNIVISNVPGPRNPLYWMGSHLEGIYPTSIVMDGLALNITVTNTEKSVDFGVVGGRRAVPSLQRILVHLDESLVELEAALQLS